MLDEERLRVLHGCTLLGIGKAHGGANKGPDPDAKQYQETNTDKQCEDSQHGTGDANPEGADQIGIVGCFPGLVRLAFPDVAEHNSDQGRYSRDTTGKIQKRDDCGTIELETSRARRGVRPLQRIIHGAASQKDG